MADNVVLSAGSSDGAEIATDEITDVHYQIVKLAHGAADSATLVSDASGLPTRTISSALPSGASTEAKQDTIIGHVDGLEGLLTTIDADTGNIATAVQLLDDAVIQDDEAFSVGTTKVHMAGFFADDTAPDSVTEGDGGAARMSLDRKQYVIAHHETTSIYEGGTARAPAFAAIDVASSGNNTIVSAQSSSLKIRVVSLFLVSAGTVTVRFESGADGTALTGQMNLVANTGFVLPYNPAGWFQTAAETLLNLELSGNVSVDGCVTWIPVL